MPNASNPFLPDGYDMSDLGTIREVLAHVYSPAKSMICEDHASGYFIYSEQYRDLPPSLFQYKIDLVDRLVGIAFDRAFGERIESTELTHETQEKYENVDWAFHEPKLMPGHQYVVSLLELEDVHQEIKYARILLGFDYEDDIALFFDNARVAMNRYGYEYAGIRNYRAMWWLNHLNCFDYAGRVNDFATDDWESSTFKSFLDQVVEYPIPFYGSKDFGKKKKKKDVWQITKYQASRVARSRQAGQLFEIPPHYSGGYKKREFFTSLGLFGRKDLKSFTFKIIELPNPDNTIEMGEITEWQAKQLERQERARQRK